MPETGIFLIDGASIKHVTDNGFERFVPLDDSIIDYMHYSNEDHYVVGILSILANYNAMLASVRQHTDTDTVILLNTLHLIENIKFKHFYVVIFKDIVRYETYLRDNYNNIDLIDTYLGVWRWVNKHVNDIVYVEDIHHLLNQCNAIYAIKSVCAVNDNDLDSGRSLRNFIKMKTYSNSYIFRGGLKNRFTVDGTCNKRCAVRRSLSYLYDVKSLTVKAVLTHVGNGNFVYPSDVYRELDLTNTAVMLNDKIIMLSGSMYPARIMSFNSFLHYYGLMALHIPIDYDVNRNLHVTHYSDIVKSVRSFTLAYDISNHVRLCYKSLYLIDVPIVRSKRPFSYEYTRNDMKTYFIGAPLIDSYQHVVGWMLCNGEMVLSSKELCKIIKDLSGVCLGYIV